MGRSGPLPSIVRKREISILKNSLSSYYLNLYIYLSLQLHAQWTWTSDFMSWQIPFSWAHLQGCSSAFCLEPWMVSWGNLIVGFIGKESSSKLHWTFLSNIPLHQAQGAWCLKSLQDKKAFLLSVKRIKLLLNKEDPFETNSSQQGY